jgi:AcrR family transcriptional regulator
MAYRVLVPKLWNQTIEAHRRDVQAAVVATTARLVAAEGPLSVTMSRIAEETGIGRATLYKYFPDVESILLAWHDRQIAEHLERLGEAGGRVDDAEPRLAAVLTTYASILHESHGNRNSELAAFLHGGERTARAERELHDMVRDLIAAATEAGAVRDDTPADELAAYCLNALAAAGHASTKAAVKRLVAITITGLRPETAPRPSA